MSWFSLSAAALKVPMARLRTAFSFSPRISFAKSFSLVGRCPPPLLPSPSPLHPFYKIPHLYTGPYRPAQPVRRSSSLATSFLSGTNASYVEDTFLRWRQNPSSVHASWDAYFKTGQYTPPPNLVADYSGQGAPTAAATPMTPSGAAPSTAPASTPKDGLTAKEVSAIAQLTQMVRAFQVRGHFFAKIDPLGIEKVRRGFGKPQELELSHWGFTEADLDRTFPLQLLPYVSGFLHSVLSHHLFPTDRQSMTLREIYQRLLETYSSTIGVEYMHIPDVEQCDWIREHFETAKAVVYSKKEKLQILDRLTWADHFERFLAKKFNAKRFGLEGAESMIVSMKALISRAANVGVEHVIIGMPHRGRLNVLSTVIRKPMEQILNEFAGVMNEEMGTGDVKYHLGMSHSRDTGDDGRKMRLSLLANPSHLEAVDPVVCGKVKARQFFSNDTERSKVLGLLLHGDAAFAGQGVVYETFAMSGLNHYGTGGTIHIVVNNQVGFTTDPTDGRSGPYCTDIAKAVGAPIFHVNGDDPEAVARVAELAAEWRQRFKKDIVIDLVCYRLRGHNEMDEPAFTQPRMYSVIRNHPSSLKIYTDRLIAEGTITKEEAQEVSDKVNNWLEEKYKASKDWKGDSHNALTGVWSSMVSNCTYAGSHGMQLHRPTGLPIDTLNKIGLRMCEYPSDFDVHKNIQKIYKAREDAIRSGTDLDWGCAETLAFATLSMEGVHVRLSGQDSQRGTFSHRHAVLHDQTNLTRPSYMPLAHLSPTQAPIVIANSPLSEFGVLGFEYGYSLESPNQLVLWEAQFGDFTNGAQVIIDQFISCAENKWLRSSGLVMLLPHAYEGAGPEHSSGRVERFLQNSEDDPSKFVEMSSAEAAENQVFHNNWQVCNITTPANLFHALRRQVHRAFRKPLIVMSPKSVLKHRLAKSNLSEFAQHTRFQAVLGDPLDIKKPRRVLFCSGKVYYDLFEAREKRKIKDVAIIRVEQIAPFPFSDVLAQSERYAGAEMVWVQEEPMNMGCWTYVEPRFVTALKKPVRYIGRPTSAAPATGSHHRHEHEMKEILDGCFGK